MPNKKMPEISLAVLDILKNESDEQHPLSMPALQSLLEDQGLHFVRQTVYRCIEILKERGIPVIYKNSYHAKGYYLKPFFTDSEALFLMNMIQENRSLSNEDQNQMKQKLSFLLSRQQNKSLPVMNTIENDMSDSMLEKISLLLEAIQHVNPVEFLYFDLDIHHKKKYRHGRKYYKLVPYALVPYQNRYYCVLYDNVHQDFTNYRLDKMDEIKVDEDQQDETHPFDLERWLQSSFNMYHGEGETVTVRFHSSMASLLFDQFSVKDVIIREIDHDSFTVSLRTAQTPTLTAWLIMYHDRCTVLSPESLRKNLKEIGTALVHQYEVNNDGRQN